MLDQGQQGPDFLRTQHGGQCLDTPGAYEVKDGPRALQRPLVEEPNPLEMHAERALGDFLLIQQEEAILAELRFAELVGSTSIVASQLPNSGDITRLGLGGEAPQLQVFPHTASERVPGDPPVCGAPHRAKWFTRIRKIDGRSDGWKSAGKAERRQTSLADYRVAVSFNSLTPSCRLPGSETVHGAVDPLPAPVEHVGIDHRCLHIPMPQEFPYGADIVAIFQEMCGERMA